MWTLGDTPFEARWESAQIAGLNLSRTAFSPHSVEHKRFTTREEGDQDKLTCVIRLAGMARSSQHGRTTVERPGDITVFDRSTSVSHAFDTPMQTLRLEVSRARLERMLGSARLFAALTVGADLPSASLVRTFFDELIRVHETLSADTAERMASIGIDLLVASLAERMAQETPKSLQATVTVQRAKAHVEANLGDPTLDPPQLAAAVGVSLRHLHQLFHEHDQNISDWIWGRRLEEAARRLADAGYAHLSIGTVSYACGFTNQAHFSKRFRDRFAHTPSEHRRAALMPGI